MRNTKPLFAACLLSAAVLAATTARADDDMRFYEVTITNLTRAQAFTPVLVATHRPNVALFTLGAPASMELAAIAEGGNIAPMRAMLDAMPAVGATAASSGLVMPGASVSIRVSAEGHFQEISLVSMLVNTNDGFVALDGVKAPMGGENKVVMAVGYDAGSEPNDELCSAVPGPACGGAGGSPEAGGEGYVHIHSGVHGGGDLNAAEYDWRNPVAKVSIRRVKE